MMNIKLKIEELGLHPDDTIIIGSGILNALNLRESKDIDAIVTEAVYERLSHDSHFKHAENHGKAILADNLFEIGTSWTVLDKTWEFNDLLPRSTIIDGVRYNSIEFLLDTKKRWIAEGDTRQKDIDDVSLMENYLQKNV